MNGNSRNQLKLLLYAAIVLLSLNSIVNMNYAQETKPRVAISMDDPNTGDTPLLDWNTRNENIFASLKKYNLQAALYVCAMRVTDSAGSALLKRWNEEGHLICNHSFSHLYFNSSKINLESYITDFLRCDSLIKNYPHYTKLFRYPYLKEGNTIEKRDGFRECLQNYGYKTGYVSIDASDWYVDQRMKEKLKANPNADLTPYKEFYLAHILERALYYDKLAKEITGREVSHVLLIHHNLLNALFLGDLIKMFLDNGWDVINASDAYTDKIYDELPDILPAGESIIWALAKQTGKYDNVLRYPGEDSEYEEDKMNKLGL